STITPADRLELEELRAEKERLVRTNEELRTSGSKLQSQIHELQNSNAQLIEDHTRDVLSIKAKETQLVRARSDAEAAEAQVQRLGRELERLKKEMRRMEMERGDAAAAEEGGGDHIYRERNNNGAERPTSAASQQQQQRVHSSASRSESRPRAGRGYGGSPSEEKENGLAEGEKKNRSPVRQQTAVTTAAGAPLPARREISGGSEGESWKRAAEVTSQLKARIELMKAKQGLTKR
ncbi:MAG: hypothetical protein Q9212_004199, partial [Teloschistes hypoglaucus]